MVIFVQSKTTKNPLWVYIKIFSNKLPFTDSQRSCLECWVSCWYDYIQEYCPRQNMAKFPLSFRGWCSSTWFCLTEWKLLFSGFTILNPTSKTWLPPAPFRYFGLPFSFFLAPWFSGILWRLWPMSMYSTLLIPSGFWFWMPW